MTPEHLAWSGDRAVAGGAVRFIIVRENRQRKMRELRPDGRVRSEHPVRTRDHAVALSKRLWYRSPDRRKHVGEKTSQNSS